MTANLNEIQSKFSLLYVRILYFVIDALMEILLDVSQFDKLYSSLSSDLAIIREFVE